MNIYIYGSKSFKKDVHDELDHSNIKFKLDDSSAIVDIDGLDDLKRLIENNSDDIFLIDDAKIIKKDALQGKFKSKLKFLIPKDGIEEQYLFEHGIGDISFDSIDELSKHITNKITLNSDEDIDNQEAIHETISDIVNDAYSAEDDSIKLNDELSDLLVSNDFEQKIYDEDEAGAEPLMAEKYNAFELEEEMTQLSHTKESTADELLDDLMHMEISNDDFDNSVDNVTMKELEDLSISNDDFQMDNESKKKNTLRTETSELEEQLDGLTLNNDDFDLQSNQNEIKENLNMGKPQGDYEMVGDFSSLDDINESDIIAALNGEEVSINETQVLTSTKKSDDVVSLNLDNTDNIAELLSTLLKNKTLEITVKIKE